MNHRGAHKSDSRPLARIRSALRDTHRRHLLANCNCNCNCWNYSVRLVTYGFSRPNGWTS